jgi:hypothetical protein
VRSSLLWWRRILVMSSEAFAEGPDTPWTKTNVVTLRCPDDRTEHPLTKVPWPRTRRPLVQAIEARCSIEPPPPRYNSTTTLRFPVEFSMWKRSLFALTVPLFILGCNAPPSAVISYLPPSSSPAKEYSALVLQRHWLAWRSIFNRLQHEGLAISEADQEAGHLIVRYLGDPQPYVDCGWIIAHQRREATQMPAAADAAIFLRQWQGQREVARVPAAIAKTTLVRNWRDQLVTVQRDLQLDARMTVQVSSDGSGSLVRTEVLYELTERVNPKVAEDMLRHESVLFRTGQRATFSSGTICQPNGEFEGLVLKALSPLPFPEPTAP